MLYLSFSDIANRLVSTVYADDMQSQEHYLKFIAQAREIPLEYLKSIGAIFIPNNEYIKHFVGAEATRREYDLYYGSSCVWTHFLMIPIRTASGVIKGFVGWDAANSLKLKNGAVDLTTYRTSNKLVFNKNNFFLTDHRVLEGTFDTSCIFVVDGVFDAISLNANGIPAMALLGSSPSKCHYYFLHWYKHIYILSDNDEAGLYLYKRLHSAFNRALRVTQSEAKDIDDYIKLHRHEAVNALRKLMLKPVSVQVDISNLI